MSQFTELQALLDLATDPYELESNPPDPRQIARRLDHRLRDAQR